MTDGKDELEWIGELELTNRSYEFDLWRLEYDQFKRVYRVGTDSGCSCPVPFANGVYINNLSYRQALALLDSEMANSTIRNQGWFVDAFRCLRERLRAHARENYMDGSAMP